MERHILLSENTRSFYRFIPTLLLLLVACVVFVYLQPWEEVVTEQPDGSYTLAKAREEAIAEKIDKFETKTELYMLVAELSSYYLCPACPPKATSKGKYFLKEGRYTNMG